MEVISIRDEGLMGIRYARERGVTFTRWGGGDHGTCGMRIIYCNSFYPCTVSVSLTIVPLKLIAIRLSSKGSSESEPVRYGNR